MSELFRNFGLHPLVGFGAVAADWMLFGAEAASLGIGWAISVPVAAALALPASLIQKHSFGDPWGAALGKSLLLAVLVAIPTPLPSAAALAAGALGAAKAISRRQKQ